MYMASVPFSPKFPEAAAGFGRRGQVGISLREIREIHVNIATGLTPTEPPAFFRPKTGKPMDPAMTPESRVRRSLLAALGLGTLSACGATPTLDLAADALKLAFSGSSAYPRTRDEVEALPYAQLGIRQGNGPRGILVLADRVHDQLHWISSDRVLVATRGHRIVKTVGLERDISVTRLFGPDLLERYDLSPESINGLEVRSLTDIGGIKRFDVTMASRYKVEASEAIDILGQTVDCLRVREDVSSEALGWRQVNHHWLSKRSALAWRSRQHVAPGQYPLEFELLKRPA